VAWINLLVSYDNFLMDLIKAALRVLSLIVYIERWQLL